MEETTNSIIDGGFDYVTGEYIGEPIGEPKTLEGLKLWRRVGFFRKKGRYGGLVNWLMLPPRFNTHSQANRIIKRYAREVLGIPVEKGIAHEVRKNKLILISLAQVIQKDFTKFVNWYKENYKKNEKSNPTIVIKQESGDARL